MLQLIIPKRSSCCTACSKPFEGGESLLTLLAETSGEAYARQDLCDQCAKPDDSIGQWRSIYPQKGKKPKSLSGTEQFLEKFREDQDPERRYLIALYLKRRGLFNQVKMLKRKGGDVAIFEMPSTGEAFEVPIVSISLSLDDL